MRRKRRLAQQEIQWVNEYITGICIQEGLNPEDEVYRSSGWVSFLALYQHWDRLYDPGFWFQARKQMTGAILFDKKERTSRLYQELSLDCPIFRNSEETFLDRLPVKNGDFTNGVAFFDFIGRLPSGLRQLSGCILAGYTLEESRSRLNWTGRELLTAVDSLRAALYDYETC